MDEARVPLVHESERTWKEQFSTHTTSRIFECEFGDPNLKGVRGGFQEEETWLPSKERASEVQKDLREDLWLLSHPSGPNVSKQEHYILEDTTHTRHTLPDVLPWGKPLKFQAVALTSGIYTNPRDREGGKSHMAQTDLANRASVELANICWNGRTWPEAAVVGWGGSGGRLAGRLGVDLCKLTESCMTHLWWCIYVCMYVCMS